MNDMTPPIATNASPISRASVASASASRMPASPRARAITSTISKLPGMLFGDFVRSPYAHARIKSINAEAALALPGVIAVLTAKDLEPLGLHWMPTLAGDKQMVLADGKVLFQGQEVAFVVASDRYVAADAIELVEVEYDDLPVITDPFKALEDGATVLREDIADKKEGAHGPRRHPNHIFLWEEGDKAATEDVVSSADVVAEEMVYYHRTHPCPLETCGCVASMDKINGKLTLYGTFQAPHVVRTVASLLSGIDEHNIRVVSPDIGGGFGNKVGVYPGYVCSIVASIVTGKPVKWIEDRMDNLMATAFARDYWMQGKIAATKEGKITGLWCQVTADHGAFDACADPTKYPAGFFHICTGSYDIPVAYVGVDGVYTNKAPGGVAYRCSFRVTEAAYFIERMIEILAQKLGMDAAELRRINFIKKEQFPYHSALGWEYDSGDYHTAWDKALEAVDYKGLRKEQAERLEAFKRGETRKLMGDRPDLFSPRSSVPARSRIATFSGWACSTAAKSASTPLDQPSHGWARSARARVTRRPLRRSSPRKSASPPTRSPSRKVIPIPHLTGSAPTDHARPRWRVPRRRSRAARSGRRRR